jgi:Lrp/AsnC family transcriptional regulator
MDAIDKKLLVLLQEDASLSIGDLMEQVHLSHTPCWKRIQRLKADGVLQKQVYLLDAGKVNLDITAFVSVKTAPHNAEWIAQFSKSVSALPHVIEFFRMSGDIDYLIRVVAPDIKAYDAVYRQLINLAELTDVSTSFALEKIKATTALPLDHL